MRRFAAAAPPTTRTPANSLTSRRAGAWNQSSSGRSREAAQPKRAPAQRQGGGQQPVRRRAMGQAIRLDAGVGGREPLLVGGAAAEEAELAQPVLEGRAHGVGKQDEADLPARERRVAPGLVARLGPGEAEAVQRRDRLPGTLEEPQPQPAAVERQPGEVAMERGRRRNGVWPPPQRARWSENSVSRSRSSRSRSAASRNASGPCSASRRGYRRTCPRNFAPRAARNASHVSCSKRSTGLGSR